jgi:hypothetical protein
MGEILDLKHVKPALPDAESVPAELRGLKQWCCYRLIFDEHRKKNRKPPHSPISGEAIGAVPKYRDQFTDFASAVEGCKKFNLDGVGFVFTAEDDFVGIDFDNAVADGRIKDSVQNWMPWFEASYKEFSISGTGVHLIVKGKLNRAVVATELPNGDGASAELYSEGRFFTVSGNRIGEPNPIGDCAVSLKKLLQHLKVAAPDSGPAAPGREPDSDQQQRSMSVADARRAHAENLKELRNAPMGAGNALLNGASFFAGQVFRALEKNEEQIKKELLHIVCEEWSSPHDLHGARQTIKSGWSSGLLKPINLVDVVTVEQLKRPDMPASVLCGKLGEICRTRMGDFPIAFSWLAVLSAASVMVKPHEKLRCNINTCLVGDVNFGKSQAQDRANFLFRLHEQGLLDKGKYGSAEGLLDQIGDRKGQPLLWWPDELSHVLEKAQIQGASFPFILNTLFYEDGNKITVQHRKKVEANVRLSITGGIVEKNFEDSFGVATTAGLYDRFLFGLFPSGNFEYSYRPMEGEPIFKLGSVPAGTLFDPLTMQLAPLMTAPRVDPSVWDARDEMRKNERIEGRILEMCIRTALICAAWDEQPVLRASDLGPAWELARYQQRVRAILRPNSGKNFEGIAGFKILDYLKEHSDGDKWLQLRDVYRATHIMDFGPSVAERAVNGLFFAREIDRMSIRPPKGGREKVLIRLSQD